MDFGVRTFGAVSDETGIFKALIVRLGHIGIIDEDDRLRRDLVGHIGSEFFVRFRKIFRNFIGKDMISRFI